MQLREARGRRIAAELREHVLETLSSRSDAQPSSRTGVQRTEIDDILGIEAEFPEHGGYIVREVFYHLDELGSIEIVSGERNPRYRLTSRRAPRG